MFTKITIKYRRLQKHVEDAVDNDKNVFVVGIQNILILSIN